MLSVRRFPESFFTAEHPFAEPLRTLNQLFQNEPFPAAKVASFNANLDVAESPEAYAVTVDVPGIRESELGIEIQGKTLVLTGKRQWDESQDKSNNLVIRERGIGNFERRITFPADIDQAQIAASLKDGVLTVTVPKSAKSSVRKIAVQTSNS